jgi:hypothetical protein
MNAQPQTMTSNTATLARAGAAAKALTNPQEAVASILQRVAITLLALGTVPVWIPLGALWGDFPRRVPLDPREESLPVRFVQWTSAVVMASSPLILVLLSGHPSVVLFLTPLAPLFVFSPVLLGRRVAASMGVPMRLRDWPRAVWGQIRANTTRFVAVTISPLFIAGGLHHAGWLPLVVVYVAGGITWSAILLVSVKGCQRVAQSELDLRAWTLSKVLALATVFGVPAQDMLDGGRVVMPTPEGGISITPAPAAAVLSFDAAEDKLARLLPEFELVSGTLEALILGPVSEEKTARRAAQAATGGLVGEVKDSMQPFDLASVGAPIAVGMDLSAGFGPVAGGGEL